MLGILLVEGLPVTTVHQRDDPSIRDPGERASEDGRKRQGIIRVHQRLQQTVEVAAHGLLHQAFDHRGLERYATSLERDLERHLVAGLREKDGDVARSGTSSIYEEVVA